MSRNQSSALLILDMLNTFDFPEAKLLLPRAEKAAGKILKLKQRCHHKNIPVIYLNDNFGRWRSNWHEIYEKCVHKKALGRKIAERLKPDDEDYFVLKPKHSGFYGTTLDVLLKSLHVKKLIITGIAGNICVLFTAHDAHMREYQVAVPKDCIASNTDKDDKYVLNQLETVFGFKTTPSERMRI